MLAEPMPSTTASAALASLTRRLPEPWHSRFPEVSSRKVTWRKHCSITSHWRNRRCPPGGT